ncbi:MAG: hypothetical protein V4617_01650 [Gemmatimonadota bacterium]
MPRFLLVAASALSLTTFSLLAVVAAPRALLAQAGAPKHAEARNRVGTARPTDTLSVAMRDGSTFMGRVIAVRGDTAEMTTSVGTVRFALQDVTRANIVRAADIVNGEYWFPNPNTTRLLFAPTGRMIKKGEGYFSDYMLFFPGVAGGITDRITIGGGMSIFPGLDFDEQIFYVTPKVGIIAREKLNVAVGVLAARTGLGDDDEFGDGGSNTFGIPYVVSTFGGPNKSVTTGIGYGYANGKLADNPALMFGGDVRLSRRFGLVSENYVFPDAFDGALLSIGARFFGEKMAGDFGLVIPAGGGDSVVIPYLGLVVNFR